MHDTGTVNLALCNRPEDTGGGIRGSAPKYFLCPRNCVAPRKIYFNAKKIFRHKKGILPRQTLKPGYGTVVQCECHTVKETAIAKMKSINRN